MGPFATLYASMACLIMILMGICGWVGLGPRWERPWPAFLGRAWRVRFIEAGRQTIQGCYAAACCAQEYMYSVRARRARQTSFSLHGRTGTGHARRILCRTLCTIFPSNETRTRTEAAEDGGSTSPRMKELGHRQGTRRPGPA